MASAMAPRDSPGAAAACNLVVSRDSAAYGSPRSPYIARSTSRWRRGAQREHQRCDHPGRDDAA